MLYKRNQPPLDTKKEVLSTSIVTRRQECMSS